MFSHAMHLQFADLNAELQFVPAKANSIESEQSQLAPSPPRSSPHQTGVKVDTQIGKCR